MDEPPAAIDISTVRLAATFPDLSAFPGEFGVLTTMLSPEGVRVELSLPGGETRSSRTSGRALLSCYAFLAEGQRAPWCLGEGIAETDGDRVHAPGSPPLVGSVADFRRSLGSLLATLFAELEANDAEVVPAVERCLGPGLDVDVSAVVDRVDGRRRA